MPRRLSTRRGSVSAPDPFALHPDLNPRESFSTLTILRVSPSDSTNDSPRRHRRFQSDSHPRLSFAFSSGPASTSPHSSSPTSPSLVRQSSIKPRLPPDQLVDLARQSAVPRFVAPSGDTLSTPVTFTPLPSSIYLPFVDRPAEVAALIASPPTSKLFSLLAQTFPRDAGPATGSDLPTDPTKWSFAHLSTWLTQIDRETASDPVWVLQARKCIHSRSELIWERVKGALGVPPELDVDALPAEDEYDDDVFESESEYGGMSPSSRRDSMVSWMDSSSISRSPVAEHSVAAFLPDQDVDPTLLGPSAALTVLIATPATNQQIPSNPSLAQDTGLQDISEAAEDEDAGPEADGAGNASNPLGDEDVATLPQIHGLRISTSHAPVSVLHSGSSPASSPRPSQRMFGSALSSRSGSFSSLGGTGAPMRHFSFSSSSFRRSASFGSFMATNARSGADYDVNRQDSRPLFPSTFARMASSGTVSR